MKNAKLTRLKNVSSFRRIAAFAWDEPRNPTILGSLEVRADRLLEWLDLKRRETGQRLTITHAVARAIAIVLSRHPDLNCMVRNDALWQREDIDVFLQVAIPAEGGVGKTDLSGYCVRQADRKDIAEIAVELRASAKKIREGKDEEFERTKGMGWLPTFIFKRVLSLIQFLQYRLNLSTKWMGAPRDPFGSVMVTSLGMHGIRVGYAPFFPMARCPMLLLVGAVEEKPVVEDGAVVVRKMLILNATFDHRVIDGYHAAQVSAEMKSLLELPSQLEFAGERDHMLGNADSTTDLETLDLDTATAEAHIDEIQIGEING